MTISEVYKEYRDEGKSKREAAVICLDVMTTGFFSAIEEPMRTDAINDFIKKRRVNENKRFRIWKELN